MKNRIELLLEQLRQLNYSIRSEKGVFRTSVCEINGKYLILINIEDDDNYIEEVIINELIEYEKRDIYLMPVVREVLESVKKVKKIGN